MTLSPDIDKVTLSGYYCIVVGKPWTEPLRRRCLYLLRPSRELTALAVRVPNETVTILYVVKVRSACSEFSGYNRTHRYFLLSGQISALSNCGEWCIVTLIKFWPDINLPITASSAKTGKFRAGQTFVLAGKCIVLYSLVPVGLE